MAPIGAAAVLLFAVPANPLAQPWSIIGGNMVAAALGVTCALLINDIALAATLALSLALMFALRCVHPPSGAFALSAVLGSPAINALGYGFVVCLVAINSFILLAAPLIYNNGTRCTTQTIVFKASQKSGQKRQLTLNSHRPHLRNIGLAL